MMKNNQLVIVVFLVLGVIMIGLSVLSVIFSMNTETAGQKTNTSVSSTSAILAFPQVAEATPTLPAKVVYRDPGVKKILRSAKWVPQTFNNCGPATTSMALQYFGYQVSQAETKAALRTNPKDSNVFTYEIRDYLKSKFNIEGKLLFNGNVQILKTLIENDIYIVIENWLRPHEDIGHNMMIRGYDDELGVFYADDPYFGVGVKYKYDSFEIGQWKPFNREYMPIYLKDKEAMVRAIVGENWDEKIMYENSIAVARSETELNPKDMYAWFNLGTSYYGLGNYQLAAESFEKSRVIGWPKRMLWYQIQPVQTYNKLGMYNKALQLAREGLSTYESFPELHYESAIAYKGLGDIAKARSEVEKTLLLAPNYLPAINLKANL